MWTVIGSCSLYLIYNMTPESQTMSFRPCVGMAGEGRVAIHVGLPVGMPAGAEALVGGVPPRVDKHAHELFV